MKMKNICIITYEYPSDNRMTHTFLEDLVNQFVDSGINCYVISPQSIMRNVFRKYKFNRKKYIRLTTNNNKVEVYAPIYFTYTKLMVKKNLKNFIKAVEKIFLKISQNIKIDAIYGHFIFPSAITANELGKKYNIPAFFAYGECSEYTINYLGKEKTRELLKGINGVISVSKENKRILLKNNIIKENLIEVIPNAINNKVFYKKDKDQMREKFGFKKSDFIVAFVGSYIERKGIDRLCEALRLINNNNIKAVLIGEGNIRPNYKNIIFNDPLDHKKIADYLSASDIFVLPTVSEGCCNAIIEALACGLPVISSSQTFNDEILDDSCSLRIDSMNVIEIKESIEKLYKSEDLRNKLSIGALKKAKMFNIEERARKIIEFMEKNTK